MLYLVYCTLGFLCVYDQFVFSNPVTYDQRQNGDVNVQIHLKDVQVVALLDTDLLDDYTDYDYAYDYADFTVKPITKPTTSTSISSTTTIKPWSTWPTKPSPNPTTTISNELNVQSSKLNITEMTQESTISTSQQQESTTESKISTNETSSVKLRINDKDSDHLFTEEQDDDAIVKIDDEKKMIIDTTTSDQGTFKKKSSCPTRYVLDKKGRCRSIKNRRRISLVPLTMRLGSRLSEKGNFNVRKDLPIRIYKSGQKL